ncbi:DUF3667 domain-containing protein [Pedobacter cryophilus]|uniref:DUF3667 domain-containing protein n=1 Tax=Pedobacter cryophilus TaxID=2571271 RepID=A0A4U1BZ30_9SPHI|nr:DUF3667 domain-containing protein [Pedobacter cryophilus]TKB97771.1 DUF3667 domain-containing protein [Pedobacter cryophilus]
MSKHYRKQSNCLNCGATVKGKFCGNCGQENLDLHEPFWHFLSHSIGHYFHFDSKFFNTIIPLFTKPGQLTIDYINGKRTQYLQPVSLFIFISIVYFLFRPILNPQKESSKKNNVPEQISIPSEYENNLNFLPKQLQPEVKNAVRKEQISLFKSLKEERQQVIIDSFKNIASKQKDAVSLNNFITELEKTKGEPYEKEIESSVKSSSKDIIEKYGSKVFFILTPIFAFFLMKSFRKNKRYFIEHVIYTLHFHSFAFLVLLVYNILHFIIPNFIIYYIAIIVFGVFVWYIYKSLKVVYKRSGSVTVFKMITLGILYSIAYGLSTSIVQTIVNSVAH